ncbi:DUF4983 domain-containing protein [Pedobacter sp. N36a]|uniref:LamG-like jellyroll fold domain-containing protein n=1 Tax=Pedobacter sp. N36a TaxID=2767996 RepID=UPI0016575487|nr:LamG-like jellyroll fold domain-containing protein [Pedobacter sp. N36a]MBC8986300.1 DUF4983 domain-containing protein [Pedobacter sp. N36a]
MMNYKNKTAMLMTGAALTLFATLFNACKKYDNPPPVFEEYGRAADSYGERKVLIITIDGAVGAEVKKLNPVNIAGMLKNSKYSFDAVSDAKTNTGTTWASLITGVTSSKHRVLDEEFNLESLSEDHNEVAKYPTALARMLDVRPEFKTLTATSNKALNNYLIHADRRVLASNDQQVKDSVVKALQTDNQRVLIADLRGVVTAGTTFGFSAEVPEYKDAIEKADAYIGEMLDALKKRKDYAKEDWLVIVSSSHGGVGKTYGGASIQERNIFSIFYNPNFKPFEMKANPYYSVRYWGKGDNAVEVAAGRVVRATANDPTGLYNPGNGSMTIMAKILINKNADGKYNYIFPPFLSKITARTGATAGWSFFRNDNGVTFFVGNGTTAVQPRAENVGTDGKWHTITGTIGKVGADFKINMYVDGLKSFDEVTLPGTSQVTSTAPLVMGYQPEVFSGGYINLYMSDLKIWNKVLSESAIKAAVTQTEVPTTDPDYPNLVSYWPGNDGGTNTIKNKVANRPNFTITGKYSWDLLAATPATGYGPADPKMILLQNVDVTTQMFYWLRVPTKAAWNLDGTVWLDDYETEFIKR